MQSLTTTVGMRVDFGEVQGFFAASIGMEAGLSIVEQKAYLDSSLDKAQNAIVNSDADEFGTGCIELAKILFEIYPLIRP